MTSRQAQLETSLARLIAALEAAGARRLKAGSADKDNGGGGGKTEPSDEGPTQKRMRGSEGSDVSSGGAAMEAAAPRLACIELPELSGPAPGARTNHLFDMWPL